MPANRPHLISSSFAFLILIIYFTISQSLAQNKIQPVEKPYETVAKKIIAEGLQSRYAYTLLKGLIDHAPMRLVGSEGAAGAVIWGKKVMEDLGFENVHTEPVMVPHWVRGFTEEAEVVLSSGEKIPLTICALGGSVATTKTGIVAEVVQVKSFDELHQLGETTRGKIIFYNRPMDPAKFNTFEAYGSAVNQRSAGAVEAGKVGGIAALVRSVTSRADDVPHTGAMHYNDSIPPVPAAAVSVKGADLLDSLLKIDPKLKVRIILSSRTMSDVESANVMGELKGSEKPGEVIVVSGHIDSWDKGQGAHDDGSGCVQSIEALRILKILGLQPKRTIRAVLFMNEEFGLQGGTAYATKDRPGERHITAIEADMGGFTPRGFGISADSNAFTKISSWSYLLDYIDAGKITYGGGGADISELGRRGVITMGLRVDMQRYFDFHHSANDVIGAVNERELELGAIATAILAYVLAQEGI
jgi:carboxypeptidase Q